MKSLARFLQKTELFADLSETTIQQEILPRGHFQEYAKGQFLIEPQQRIENFGIILSGKVHILHIFSDGFQSLMGDVTTGEITGVDLICTRSRLSPYHAVAVEATRVFYLPAHILTRHGILDEQDRLQCLDRLLMLISNENMKKEYRLAILSQKGLRERILIYLHMQAARRGKNTFAISFSREELAAFLCVNRSALSHELSLMQQEGLVQFRKNVFTVCVKTHSHQTPEKYRLPTEEE